MDKSEAQAILWEHVGKYRRLAYGSLEQRLNRPENFVVAGSSGREYQIEVQMFWDDKKGGDIRVMLSIDDGGLRALAPVCDSFILRRDGSFVDE